MNADELISQATNHFNAGESKVALALVVEVLGCRQDVRFYRFAVYYACTAHDLPSAKKYFAYVPRQFQASLEQRCQQENLNLKAP